MRYSLEEKLKIVKEHVEQGVPIHELKSKYGIDPANLKYFCALYKLYGDVAFEDHGTRRSYNKELKLFAIDQVLSKKKSSRKVGLELMLTDHKIVDDWVKLFKTKGPDAIKDTHSRSHYLVHEERLNVEANKKLLDRLEYLEAENEYLKKLYALAQEKKSHKKKK